MELSASPTRELKAVPVSSNVFDVFNAEGHRVAQVMKDKTLWSARFGVEGPWGGLCGTPEAALNYIVNDLQTHGFQCSPVTSITFPTVSLDKPIDELLRLGLVEVLGGELILSEMTWGDYCGSYIVRSNSRWLQQNYPDHVDSYGWEHSGVTTYLTTRNIPTELAAIIVGCSRYGDYPIISEDDLYALEVEMADESAEFWQTDVANELAEYLSFESFDDLVDASAQVDLSEEDVMEVYRDVYRETHGYDGEAETATSWVWPGKTTDSMHDEMALRLGL